MQTVSETTEGKSLLVIGSGCELHYQVWEFLKSYGLKVVLVDYDENNHGLKTVDKFIQYNFKDHQDDPEHARNICRLVTSDNIDGCFTFSEVCVPLTSKICKIMNLPGWEIEAADIVKHKYKVLNLIKSDVNTKPYSSEVFMISCQSDLLNIPKDFPFPAVLKPNYGVATKYVKKVSNIKECIEEYGRLSKSANFGFDNSMVLMEYISGSAHEAEVVLVDGCQLAVVIGDYGPSVSGRFLYTCYHYPTSLSCEDQMSLREATQKICHTIGLNNGVCNFEFRMTAQGPKLIEVNGRMIVQPIADNIKTCLHIDILLAAVQICLGIKPTIQIHQTTDHLVVANLYASFHRDTLQNPDVQRRLHELNRSGTVQYFTSLQGIPCNDEEFELFLSFLTVVTENLDVAKDLLIEVFEELELDHPVYAIRNILSNLQ